MPVCEMDLCVGGIFRWRWRSEEDGTEFGFHGEFLASRDAALATGMSEGLEQSYQLLDNLLQG